jgi:rare lipoprotein A
VVALIRNVCIVAAIALLAACGHTPGRSDGAPLRKVNPEDIKDATPQREPITRAGNKSPYTVLGQTYVLLPSAKGYRATGIASWYGTKFHGESTANGDRYDLYGMTAAHKTLPIPTYVLVTNLENNKQAIVRVNDRGPFVSNRVIDLSYAAATKLGYADKGTAFVEVVAIDVDNWPPREVPVPAPTVTPPLLPAPPSSGVSNSGAGSNVGPASVAGNYFVQVGAFSVRAGADQLRARLADAQQYPVSVQPTTGSPVLYRVRVGPCVNRDAAEKLRGELLEKHMSESARVVESDAH